MLLSDIIGKVINKLFLGMLELVLEGSEVVAGSVAPYVVCRGSVFDHELFVGLFGIL